MNNDGKVKQVNSHLLKSMADIESVMNALGKPVTVRQGKNGPEYQVLNVFRDDRNLGSCYFARRYPESEYPTLTDWADRDSAYVNYTRKDGTEVTHAADIVDYVEKAAGCSFMDACQLIADSSGIPMDDIEQDVSLDEIDDQAKKLADIRARKEKNRRIAALLGLEHQEKRYDPFRKREETYLWHQEQDPFYRHYDCWQDKDVLCLIEDGYDYHITFTNRKTGQKKDFWVSAKKLAEACARKSGARIMMVDQIEANTSMFDHTEMMMGLAHRVYDEAVSILMNRGKEAPLMNYVYVVYRDIKAPTLTELEFSDPEAYNFLIESKKKEVLSEINEQIKTVRNTVFDKTEYESSMSVLKKRKEEILAI